MTLTVNDEAYGAGWRKPVFYEAGMRLRIELPDKRTEDRDVLAVDRCGPEGWCKLTMGPKL